MQSILSEIKFLNRFLQFFPGDHDGGEPGMGPVLVVVQTQSGADSGFAVVARSRDLGAGFEIQMLRQVQIVPEPALGHRVRLVGLDHVVKGQRSGFAQGLDVNCQRLGLRQEQPHEAVHGIAHVEQTLLPAVQADAARGMSREMEDLQQDAAQIEGVPLPYWLQLPGLQGKISIHIKIHWNFSSLQLHQPVRLGIVLPAQVHVGGMDVSAAELGVTAGVIHMAVGVENIQRQVRDAPDQIFETAEAVAGVEQQCVVAAHDQIHEDHAVANAVDPGFHLPDGVD